MPNTSCASIPDLSFRLWTTSSNKTTGRSASDSNPTLYHVIEHHGDIPGLERVLSGYQDFVIKPARAPEERYCACQGAYGRRFCQAKWPGRPIRDLSYHISDILSGIYSLEGLEDRAFIEGLVHPDMIFDAVTYCASRT